MRFSVFFFQAEDGIRDKLVTGVQTCALPISRAREVIAGGETAGRAALPQIEAALARRRLSRRAGGPRAPVVEPESVLGTSGRVDPAGLVPEGFLARALGLRRGSWVSRATLDQRMSRVYATRLFERVGDRLERGDL